MLTAAPFHGCGSRFAGNITLTAGLPAEQNKATVNGGGNTLSGSNQFCGLFTGAFSGSAQTLATVEELSISNTRAAGGSSGEGGGAGLGGAIGVADAQAEHNSRQNKLAVLMGVRARW